MSKNTVPLIRLSTPIESIKELRYVESAEEIAEHYPNYLIDESKLKGEATWLFFPKNEQELVKIVEYLNQKEVPYYVCAARTGIVGSSVPLHGAIISLEKMNSFLGLGYDDDREEYFFRVEPGITLTEINQILLQKKLSKLEELTPDAFEKYKNEDQEYYYPVDPTEMSASIGGTVATNASGARTFKFGPTRDWIKRIRVLLPTAEILDIPRGKYKAKDGKFVLKDTESNEKVIELPSYNFNTEVKNAAGVYIEPNMDLIDLFIGSEGLLGIITQIDAYFIEKKSLITNVLFFKTEEDSWKFVDLLRREGQLKTEFIEYMGKNALQLLKDVQQESPKTLDMPKIPSNSNAVLFFDFTYSEDSLEDKFGVVAELADQCNTSLDDSWSSYEEREFKRFKHFRHALPETVNAIIAERKRKYPELHKLGTDMSVKNEYLEDMMRYYQKILNQEGLEYVIFGHIGDNHLHVNILPKNLAELKKGLAIYKKFAKKAVEYGGSVSAEHGIGKIKREYLKVMYSDEEIDQMRNLKRQLDPKILLNVGNMFLMEEDNGE